MTPKTQILSLSLRPRIVKEMIGAKNLRIVLQGHWKSGRLPQAWLFSGETGTGKTTIARILALAIQCPHQQEFGNPCDACQKNRSEFDILEINASEISGVDEIGNTIKGAWYGPRYPSKARVYILDEAQRISSAGQNLLLKYFEDCPKSTYWIICTTDPDKILPTLRARCIAYKIPGLHPETIKELVTRALRSVGSNLLPDRLADALFENSIRSPRLILMAVEKYTAGASVEVAARVDLSDSEINPLLISRAVTQGEWSKVAGILKKAGPEDSRFILASVMGYLRNMVLGSKPGSENGNAGALGLRRLGKMMFMDDQSRSSMLVGELFDLTAQFSGESRLGKRQPDDDED